MTYLLDQLRAYQHQLKELGLHDAWQGRATAQSSVLPHPPAFLPPIASASGLDAPDLCLASSWK